MIASQIGAAIKARLDALTFTPAIVTYTPAIPVAWPNRDYTPDGAKFIVAQIEINPNQRVSLNGVHRISGFLAIGVSIPAGGGSGEADDIADAVAAHFPCDLRLTFTGGSLRITETPSVRGGYRDGAYWRVPVTIPFEAFA